MPKYTTAAIVRAQLADRVATEWTDAEIDTVIDMNEGVIDAILKIGAGGNINLTFSATTIKHLILRKLSTSMTCSDLLMTSSVSFLSLDQAKLAAELAVFWYEECLKFLAGPKDTSVIDWIGE